MTTLGKYELHEELGRGGFGTVYRAIDTTLDREVAIKVLHPQLTTEADFLKRFRNEARLVASLKSPNIVTIYELDEVDGRVFIVMELLSGGSLKQRLEKQGAIPFEETLEIIEQASNGLAAAHKKGLVHRDIKPGNILFDGEGKAVLGDFGLARAIQQSSLSASSSTGGVGTPAYRAPELWRGKPPASPATDIYSLGCVFSEMLTGKVLFDGDTPDEILAQHLIDGPNMVQNYPGSVQAGVREIILKTIARDPADRYPGVNEFMDALAGLNRKASVTDAAPQPVPPARPVKDDDLESLKKSAAELARSISQFVPVEKPETAAKKWQPWQIAAVVVAGMAILGLIVGKAGGWFTARATPVIEPSLIASTAVLPTSLTEQPTAIPAIPTTPSFGTISTQISPVDGMEMVLVPAGDFLMGSLDGEGKDNEHPQHTVYLDAYWIDQTEVTNAMYEKCIAASACSEPSSSRSLNQFSYYGNSTYDNYPVIYVNWNQAQTYCRWAGRQLPTEAQWEKAARGTDGRMYPWGNQDPDLTLVYFNHGIDTSEVGSYPAGTSPYGALDMAGNVWEWVADWYDSDYYQSSPGSNPAGPSSGDSHVLRGGSFYNSKDNIRSAYRLLNDSSKSYYSYGFRCSLSATVSP